MTYPTPEARERQLRALSGADRAEAARQEIDEYNRAGEESRALMASLRANSGGSAGAPDRAAVDRLLGSTAAAPAPVVDELAAIRAENARHAEACLGKIPRRIADRDGVRLAGLVGTGDLGKITLTDVVAARDAQPVPRRREVVAAASARVLVERRSLFIWAQFVSVNEYGPNPLVEDIVQTNLDKAAFVLRAGDKPPTLFESGAAPVFTASGIPVEALAAVPWPARHVIARVSNTDAAFLLNKFTPGPSSDPAALAVEALMMFESDEENQIYKSRVATWFDSWEPDYAAVDASGLTNGWKKRGAAWQA